MAVTGFSQLGPSPKVYAAADQGGYYTLTNPTAGTGIIAGVVTTLADTTPLLLLKNNNAVGSKINIYMDYVKLVVSVAGIGHTAPFVALKVDRSQSVNRYTSGGTAITPQASNASAANPSGNGLAYFGAITAAAAGDARLLSSHRIKGALEVVLDSFTFDFGPAEQQSQNGLVDNSTTISHGLFALPATVIGPQQWLALHYFAASNSTGTTFFVNAGYWEV